MTAKSSHRIAWLCALTLLLAFQNCSKNNFSAGTGSDSTAGGAQQCQTVLQNLTVPVKVLFVVDTSGSNAASAGYPGSDANKLMRGGSIQQFFTTYGQKTNFNWGFIVFQGATASALIGYSSLQPAFTALPNVMQTAINNFYGIADYDKTPYESALQLTYTTIANDTGRASNTKYIVVFLSDGIPDPAVADLTLSSEIQSILNLSPGQISFNTIYYGLADVDASNRLRMMASAGQGQFLDTNANPTGKSFAIQDVINVPGVVCN